MNVSSFVDAIRNFGIFSAPPPLLQFTAITIALIEVVAGLFLALGLFIRVSSGTIIALLIVFIAAIIPNLAMGDAVDCGCFGPFMQEKIGIELLIRDIVLLGFGLILFKRETHNYMVEHLIHEIRRTHV